MIVQAQCPSCSTTAGVDESFAGRRVRCRKCGERFQIDPSLFGLTSASEPESGADSDESGDPGLNDFLNDLGGDRTPRATTTAVAAPSRAVVAAPVRTPASAPAAAVAEPEPAPPQPKGVFLMLLALIILGGTIAFFVWIDQVQREEMGKAKSATTAPAAAETKPAPKA